MTRGVSKKTFPEGELDDFHQHEAMDRASIWAEQFEEVVAFHPAIASNPGHSKTCESNQSAVETLRFNEAQKHKSLKGCQISLTDVREIQLTSDLQAIC